ncbi:MAG TPA: GNAT family N-acetyltransferase [Myxococcales bacterium]|nr:GNAT family N-acetyltransferase [Myxococcales bacterium]
MSAAGIARFCEQAAAADGTRLLLRLLSPSDGAALRSSVARMSPRSRYFRFFAPKDDLTADDLRLLLAIDGERHLALGAFSQGQLWGVGRFVRHGQEAAAEVALEVGDRLQRIGIGTLLLRRLEDLARERGVARFTGQVLCDNHGMIALLRNAGAHLGLTSRGVVEARLDLSESSPALERERSEGAAGFEPATPAV